jgi:hypothetical protein
MVNALSFLTFLQQGGNVVEPFTRVMIGGGKKTSSSRTKKKTKSKTIKRKKNLSRKKATRRKNRSNKKSLKKRTKNTKNKKRTNRKRRQCNCDAKKLYTGKEPSPKGLGFCAHCSPENITMKGLDGELWRNEKYSKGKRWMRV